MLKDAVKFLAKDSAIYGLSGAIAKFIAIFTVPIVLRILTKEEFGVLNTVTSVSALLIGFASLGMDSSIARWFFDDEGASLNHKKKISSTGFFVQLSALILLLTVLFLFFDEISSLLFGDNQKVIKYWKIYLYSIPGTSFLLFSNNLFKWNFERNKYLILTLGNSILTVGLMLILLLAFRLGLYGAVIAPVISINVFAIVGLFFNRKYISYKSIGDFRLIKEMLVYGWPFGVVIIIGASLPSVDKLFLLKYTDLDILGEYSVAFKIAGLMLLVVSAFQISFGPYAFSIWKKPEAKELFSKLMLYYFMFLMLISSLLSLFGDLIINLFASKKYEESIYLLPIFSLGIVFQGMSQFSLIGITWSKKTYYNLLSSLILFLVLYSGNYLLTEKFTIYGAAITFLLSHLSYFLVTFYFSNKYYKIKIPFLKMLVIFLFTISFHYFLVYY